MNRQLLKWLNRTLWMLALVLLLPLAVYVGIGRIFIDNLEANQQSIINELRLRSSLNFTVGKLSGEWSALTPIVKLEKLSLYNPLDNKDVVLTIDRAQLRLDVVSSLMYRRLGIGIIDVDQLNIHLQEDQQGNWSLKGFPAGGTKFNINPLIDTLLGIESAHWDAAKVTMTSASGKILEILTNTLELEADEDFHRVRIDITPVGQVGSVDALFEINGDPRDFADFAINGVLNLKELNLAPILNLSDSWGFPVLRKANIDGRLWLKKQADEALSMWGILASDEIPLAPLTGRSSDDDIITDVILKLGIELNEDNVALSVSNFQGQFLGKEIRLDNWSASLNENDRKLVWRFLDFDLAELTTVINKWPGLPDSLTKTLAALSPAGHLQNVKIFVPLNKPVDFSLQADMRDVSVASWNGAPAAKGVTGYLRADAAGGEVQLDSTNFAMQFPGVYSNPVAFTQALANIGWQIGEDAVRVKSGPIYTRTIAGPVNGLLDLYLPINDPKDTRDATMTLSLGLRNVDASQRNIFIPDLLVDKSLKTWLDNSIKGGVVTTGDFIYRGSIESGKPEDFTVQLWLDVTNGILDYQKGLPAVTQVNAWVDLDDQTVTAQANSARLFETVELSGVDVAVTSTKNITTLNVKGNYAGKDAAVVEILKTGIIKEAVGGAFDNWQWRGQANGSVNINVPLSGEGSGVKSGTKDSKPDVTVDVNLQNGNLFAEGIIPNADGINGNLKYQTKSGISSSGINGRWFGSPVKLTLSQKNDTVTVNASGTMSKNHLQAWLQQPILDFVSGELRHKVRVEISPNSNRLFVESDLTGLTINLPPPFNKTAKDKLPFNLTADLAKQQQNFALKFAQLASLDLLLAQSQVGGVLTVGKPTALSASMKPEVSKFQITGNIAQADLSPWLTFIGDYEDASKKTMLPVAPKTPVKKSTAVKPLTVKSVASIATSAMAAPAITPPPTTAPPIAVEVRNLHIDQLTAWGELFKQTRVVATQQSQGWVVDVDADRLSGTIIYPPDNQPLKINLARINFPAPVPTPPLASPPKGDDVFPPPEEDTSALLNVDFSKLMNIDIDINKIYRGDKMVGRIGAQMRVTDTSLLLDDLNGDIYGLRIGPRAQEKSATVLWTKTAGQNRTEFKGLINFDNFGTSLVAMGYEKAIESKSGSVDMDLAWPQPPDDPDLGALSGLMTVKAVNGRFPETSGKASGATRVLGIFNFDNLLKRLRFDFTDIYKSGVAYDTLNGATQFNQGFMVFKSPLKVIGPGVGFRITGDIDFRIERANMELVATLPVATNLPWFAALAGGVPLAAGTYVFSKLFEKSVNSLSSVVYTITGNWQDPQVNFKRIYDSSSSEYAQ